MLQIICPVLRASENRSRYVYVHVDYRLQNRRGCSCSGVTMFEGYLVLLEVVATSRHRSWTNNNSWINRVDARVFLAGYLRYMSTLFTNAAPYLDSHKRFGRFELKGCHLYSDAADSI